MKFETLVCITPLKCHLNPTVLRALHVSPIVIALYIAKLEYRFMSMRQEALHEPNQQMNPHNSRPNS